jgi:hydroxymethylbilane synthase
MRILKLGTRKSLLAWAQSSLIAEQLSAAIPGLVVELVGIITSGDQQTDRPLHQLDGKDFFVKELDQALLRGDVDFCVHSFKDLSLQRPDGITLGAVPRRENPRDVILWHAKRTDQKLSRGEPLLVGTSSPRRLENIPPFLHSALPNMGHPPEVKMVEIRGNVNSRIGRLHNDTPLDGVVLALAGLNRLAMHHSSAEQLNQLLCGLRWMVLPLSHNPTAPAQGALAIECRVDDREMLAILAKIDDLATRTQIQAERLIMAEWGGGCHQRFGITQVGLQNPIVFMRGIRADQSRVDGIRFQSDDAHGNRDASWDGSLLRAQTQALKMPEKISSHALFIASPRAADGIPTSMLDAKRIWVSGVGTWTKLAARGVWVEGCADGLGVESIQSLMKTKVLALPALHDFAVLTHAGATSQWPQRECYATYSVTYQQLEADQIKQLREADFIYWSSATQFAALSTYSSPTAHHSCGFGKTWKALNESSVARLMAVPDVNAWRQWLKKRVNT